MSLMNLKDFSLLHWRKWFVALVMSENVKQDKCES